MEEIFGHLDFPTEGKEINPTTIAVSGWTFSSLDNKLSVEVLIDNNNVFKGEANLERTGVLNDYKSFKNSLFSGFSFNVNVKKLSNGFHNLKIIARSSSQEKIIGNVKLKADDLIPPADLITFVGSDFKEAGNEFFNFFISLGNLKPNEKFLDVGCGCGRMAVPLIRYLKEGLYEGFDIDEKGVSWCKENISSKSPNFNFNLVDIQNRFYNPNGKILSSEFKFPYVDEYFDFVSLSSVFTHMLPKDMENYFSEVSRVLKKHGRCLITYFLINSDSLENIEKKTSLLDLKYEYDDVRQVSKTNPELAVGYEENFIKKLYNKYGFKIIEPIKYGEWSGRKNFLTYQDIIIAKKIK